jgi:hypothetical protein
MSEPIYDYDLFVIGSGPAGHHAAIEAAKIGKRVAIADRNFDLGGVCLHTGTIPSKTLREAALYLSGFRQRSFYGRGYRVKAKIQIQDLMFRIHRKPAYTRSDHGRPGAPLLGAIHSDCLRYAAGASAGRAVLKRRRSTIRTNSVR